MAEIPEQELPTNKIHDYVTWPETRQIFEDGRGGLAFPDQNNSECHRDDNGELTALPKKPVTMELHVGVSSTSTGIPQSDIVFEPSCSVLLEANRIGLALTAFNYDKDTQTGSVDTVDEIPYAMIGAGAVSFAAITPDTLELTTIVTADVSLVQWSDTSSRIEFNASALNYPFELTDGISFVMMVPVANGKYVYLSHQDEPAENGVYVFTDDSYTRVADEPVRTEGDADYEDPSDILSDPTVNDNVECCDHYRKSYSHREVYDRVHSLIGDVIGFGVKSASYHDCDGGFVDWFLNDGEVNLGNGHESVFVNGFGLGSVYKANTAQAGHEAALPNDDYDENDGTLHPLLSWAYGTRYDSKTDTDLTALPRDWPFTHMASSAETPVFNALTDTSNITLVKHCAEDVGNLERDVEYEEMDPDTHEPVTVEKHVFNNRHHIVLYPDYTPVNNTNYEPNSVIVKPLFIHLPAPLDTKDGETVEITMSIQNVDPSAFGAPNTSAALSGYYAAMSQPRVYVMGGVQKFSNRKMHIRTKSIVQRNDGTAEAPVYTYTFTTDNPAYANDKETLLNCDNGAISVRANIVVSRKNQLGNVRSFTAHGQLTANTKYGTSFTFEGLFPYDPKSADINRYDFSICGMAYLEPGDNPSSTPMGLVSRDPKWLRGDMGGGAPGTLNQYNKFYAINETEGREHLQPMDKRYVLATVYQTATSTFPWALANRRKMATLDRSWTDEYHHGESSIMKMVYDQNAVLNDAIRTEIMSDYFTDTADINAYNNPLSYQRDRTSWHSVGSALRVVFPDKYDSDPKTIASGNPVRQGQAAIKMLTSDFMHMRLLTYKTGKKARVKVAGIETNYNGDWPLESAQIVNAELTPSTSYTGWKDNLVQSVWCSNVRSLPPYVLNADSYDDKAKYYMPDIQLFNADWSDYVADADFPYNKECNALATYSSACTIDDGSIIGTTETSDVIDIPTCDEYYRNSILVALQTVLTSKFKNKFYEAARYAETVLAVKVDDKDYLKLSALDSVEKDWINPFTNIQSIDSVPMPIISDSLDDPQHIYKMLSAAQHEYVSSDAVQMYRYETDIADDSIDMVSTVMPTASALGKFLEAYVAAYGAKMPKHMYQGSRVLLQNGTLNDHAIYLKRIARVKSRLADSVESLDHYIADNFANVNAATRDPNADYAQVDTPSIGISTPPYTSKNLYANETYTRVIMEFTFSQKAGRWYTTGYRQHPTNYLSPLYGADALGTYVPTLYDVDGSLTLTIKENRLVPANTDGTLPMMPLWVNSACSGFNSYRDHVYYPYSVIPAMDMNLGCVPFLTGDYENTVFAPYTDSSKGWTVGHLKPEYDVLRDTSKFASLQMLEEPYKPISDDGNGGINLYPPADINGGHKDETDDGIHANFWSVRRFIRPAVSVLEGTDIPAHEDPDNVDPETGEPLPRHTGGLISDPTLYRMFDFPVPGIELYKLPNTVDPDVDDNEHYLLYHDLTDTPVDGILSESGGRYIGYGVSEQEQDIERD